MKKENIDKDLELEEVVKPKKTTKKEVKNKKEKNLPALVKDNKATLPALVKDSKKNLPAVVKKNSPVLKELGEELGKEKQDLKAATSTVEDTALMRPKISNDEVIAIAHLVHQSKELAPYAQNIIYEGKLSQEDEKEIFQYLQAPALSHDDNINKMNAAKLIVINNLRFVNWMANKYKGYGLPLVDLQQEGTHGLMKAITKFDPEYGVRFITFAAYYIKSEIHEYIIKNVSILKIATTRAQRKLFFKLRSYKNNLSFTAEEVNKIASELDVKTEDVRNMEMRLSRYHNISLDPLLDDDDESSLGELLDDGSNFSQEVEVESNEDYMKRILYQELDKLDERQRIIISERYLREDGKKVSLQELSHRFKISNERVRQIEAAGMKKIRKAIEESHSAALLDYKEDKIAQ